MPTKEGDFTEGNVEVLYDEWVLQIANEVPLNELIDHLRGHVGEHFDRYDRSDSTNLALWLVDVLNFMHILEQKGLGITCEDMLFKLCLHYRNHRTGPKPHFDADGFIEGYQGRFKKFDALSLNRGNNE